MNFMTTFTTNQGAQGRKGEQFVCDSIVSAIRVFFVYGLSPGSCTELLLKGKYDEAKLHAHMMLRDDDTWTDHINFIEHLVPICCRNEYYDTWKGFVNLPEEEQKEIKTVMTLQFGESIARSWTNTDFN